MSRLQYLAASLFIPSLVVMSAAALAQEATTVPAPRPVDPPMNNCLVLQYPEVARRLDVTGSTRVAFTVLPSGAVTEVRVAKASGETKGHEALDHAAVGAVSRCAFAEAPGFAPRRVIQDIVWRLEE
jgi:TonB family protein